MTPIAPEKTEMQAGPVAPPDMESPAPVGVGISPVQPIDIHSMYEDAAASGDPVSMYSLTSRVKGTAMEPVIKRSAEIMRKGVEEMESVAKPVMEAGGVQTPEGRIAASKAYETIADKPQKMRAFVEMLMGNPKWRTFVTGGTPTTVVGYDRNGKQLEKTVNELGQIISVVDSETGKPLDRQQVADRGGFLASLDNALGFQQQKEISGFNAKAFSKSNEATNEYAARAPELKNLYAEMQQNLKNLNQADLSPEQRKAIGMFTSRTMGYSQTLSEGLNALRQKADNKNARLSESQTKSLDAVLGRLKWKISPSGQITNETGETVGKSELDQAQSTLSNGSEFQRGFTQNKEDFIRSEVFKNLGAPEMQILGRVLDLQGAIERSNLELTSKHGSLPFLINPKTYSIGDEFARGEASALIGEFNQDATQLFADWRKRQLETYKRNGQIPNAGELEAAFANTPEYQALRKEYADRNKQILKRPVGASPETGAKPAEQWSMDVGLGGTAKEEPKSLRGRSIKVPEVQKKSSARDIARSLGGRD